MNHKGVELGRILLTMSRTQRGKLPDKVHEASLRTVPAPKWPGNDAIWRGWKDDAP